MQLEKSREQRTKSCGTTMFTNWLKNKEPAKEIEGDI